MSNIFRLTLIWMMGCMLAFIVGMNYLPAAMIDGHYIPTGNDSFYHARRILDLVAKPGGFYEFDRFVDYPYGSWIPWPWGYDYLMAQIVRGHLWLFGPRDPISILVYIPMAAVTVMMALVLGIVSLLQLSMPMRALVVICFSLSTFTQVLHGVGSIDHHFMEQIFFLATVLIGMLWMRAPQSRGRAIALGLVLGASVAIHNGLFLLQLPVLLAMVFLWLRGASFDRAANTTFAASLLISTILVTLPSAGFRRFEFEYYWLSWFHIYVATCTSLVVLLLGYWPFRHRHLAYLGTIAAFLLIPLVTQILMGSAFLTGSIDMIKDITEARNPIAIAASPGGPTYVSELYGLLFWLAPLFLAIGITQIWRERRWDLSYFWIITLFGFVLLFQQFRFHYYGLLALYVIPFWSLEQLKVSAPRWSRAIIAASAIFAIAVMIPSIRMHLYSRHMTGLETEYWDTRAIYPELAKACKKAPGVVLASADAGHYIRYHTDCYVIANNFRLIPQDMRKLERMRHLYSLNPEALLKEAPEIRYIVVILVGPSELQYDGSLQPTPVEELRKINDPLTVSLLIDDPAKLPARFKRMMEVRLGNRYPTALVRLYEVLPETLAN